MTTRKLFTPLVLATALSACATESEDSNAIDPADLVPANEATFAGAAPILPPEEATAPTLSLLHDSDGSDDVELHSFLAQAPGVLDWEPVRTADAPEAALERISARRSDEDPAFSYVGVVTAEGHYLVEIEDDAMLQVRDFIEMSAEPGTTHPSGDYRIPASFDSDEEFRGWSYGYDSRVRMTGNNIPAMVGQVQSAAGGCSGALIGRRLVRTAAHCLISPNYSGGSVSSWATFNFRRDANAIPVSTTTYSFYYGGAYLPNNCARTPNGYGSNFDACTWADWAILILPSNWNGNTWHSWFGYKGLVGSNINMELQSGGYPGCGFPESPANCVASAYYRDTSSPCKVSAWTNGTAKFRVGCDISPGNSGGPVWEEGTAYLIGHAQWQDCGTCSSSTAAPNHYLGHDSWLFNFQNQLRTQFP